MQDEDAGPAGLDLMARRIAIRLWRLWRAEPSGLLLWFDPEREFPRLYELEPQMKSGVEGYCEGDDLDRDPGLTEQKPIVLYRQIQLPFDEEGR